MYYLLLYNVLSVLQYILICICYKKNIRKDLRIKFGTKDAGNVDITPGHFNDISL